MSQRVKTCFSYGELGRRAFGKRKRRGHGHSRDEYVNELVKPNNDERIRFIAGCHGLSALEKKVDHNPNSVAFSIFPSEISDVMRVADNNLTMPPKSTWFDPKPLDGLVVYEFN